MKKGTPITPEFHASIQEPALQISRNRGDNSNESNYNSQETQSNMINPENTTDTNNSKKTAAAPAFNPEKSQIPPELEVLLNTSLMTLNSIAEAQNRSHRSTAPAAFQLPKEVADAFEKMGQAADTFKAAQAEAQKPVPLTKDLLRTAATLTVKGVILCGLVVGTTVALRAVSPVEAVV
jgi:hypothetical protein